MQTPDAANPHVSRVEATITTTNPIERAAMWERLCDHFSERLVEIWNDSSILRATSYGEIDLAQFMGLTEEQYAAWVEGRWADVLA